MYAKSPVERADLKETREGDSFIVDGGGYIYTCALNEIEPKGNPKPLSKPFIPSSKP